MVKKIVKIIDRLRGENGCPWDKKQNAKTMVFYLLEEAYELVDAIYNDDIDNIKEELGDVLFQLIFINRLYEEKKRFTFSDVIDVNCNKMITRHPHVFENLKVKNIAEIKANWDKIKKKEKTHKAKNSLLDAVPKSLPAISRSYKMSKKAKKFGLDWQNIGGVFEKVDEELLEFKKEIDNKDKKKAEVELGDVFFSLINVARFLGINPEIALNEANKKFETRFRYVEKSLKKDESFKDLSRKEQDELWEKAKSIKK